MMNLGRLGQHGREFPVIVDGNDALDLRPLTADIDAAFLSDDPFGLAAAARARGGDTVRMEIAGLGTQEQIVRALKGPRQA